MELYDHIRKISFVFFLTVGLAHFISGLLFVNGYFAPGSGLVNRILFIPFVLATLTYGISNVKYRLAQYGKDSVWITYASFGLGLVIFIALIALELLVRDSLTPLISHA